MNRIYFSEKKNEKKILFQSRLTRRKKDLLFLIRVRCRRLRPPVSIRPASFFSAPVRSNRKIQHRSSDDGSHPPGKNKPR